jgi:hypothetical protein
MENLPLLGDMVKLISVKVSQVLSNFNHTIALSSRILRRSLELLTAS